MNVCKGNVKVNKKVFKPKVVKKKKKKEPKWK